MKRPLRRNIFLYYVRGFIVILAIGAPVSLEALDVVSQERVVALTNVDRARYGANALRGDVLLQSAAQKKADDMATRGYFAHYSPFGTPPWNWFSSVGYRYSHAGENLALFFGDLKDVESLEAMWMASPAHRANIIRNVYTEVGIGVSYGTYMGYPVTFVVQFFATPADEVFVKKSTPTRTTGMSL